MRIHLRITSVQTWASWVEGTLYGPCGFSVRTNDTNQLVPFATRITSTASPSVVVTSADVPSDGAVLFDLSEPDAITKVSFNMQNLLANTGGVATVSSGPRIAIPKVVPPADGVVVQPVLVERTSGDAGGPVQREQSYTIPGFLAADATATTYDPSYVDHFAAGIFDRMSRGRLSGEVSLLRAGTGGTLNLGDEFVCALPAMPNHNKRLKDDNSKPGRCVQVVRLTKTPTGPRVRFIDSGPNANAVATLPTFSLALGTVGGSVVATITNAATLNTAGIAARVYWAVTTGAAPATADYSALTYFAPGAVPTTAFALPLVTPGRTVYVRARGEQPGYRPSNFGTAVSIATATVGTPGSFTATPDPADGSRCALAWTVGTNADTLVTDVFLRLTADTAASDVQRITLPAGSTQYTLDDLTVSTNYTASVRHRDPLTGSATAKVTAAFTTSANTVVLTAPVVPTVFAGPQGDPLAANDGSYGLAVVATVLPGSVEFREAVETAVGSGVYGAAASIATVAAVLGDWTLIIRTAPNDGLRRQLSARSVRGATSSVWTTALAVQPWTVVKLPIYSGPLVPRLSPFTYVDTETTRVFTWTRNVAVYAVWVYDNLVTVGGADPYDTLGTFPSYVLMSGTDTYTAQKPPAHSQRFVHFVPYDVNNVAGDIRHEPVDPAPSALSGTVKAAVTNGTADLTLHISGSASNWPVAVDLFEDNPDGTAIYSTSVSAVTDIAPTGALVARALPLRELRRWYLRLTDVAGVKAWGIGSADRDALPNGSVTRTDYKALPSMTATYDDDTDQIRVTTPTGKTKTVTGLSGSGTWTYAVGDVLDDTSVETTMVPGEVRSPYVVEFHGGGTWVQFFNGPLHGAPIIALAGRARVTATSSTTVTVRYAVADPIPQGANTATITYQDQGSGGVTPASGGTVTPAATLTEAAGTYIDYTITRPAFGVGTARVTFTVTAAGRISDSDAVDVPEVQSLTLALAVSNCRATPSGGPYTGLLVQFSQSGFPSGTTFDVGYNNGVDGGVDSTTVPAAGSGTVTITGGTGAATFSTSQAGKIDDAGAATQLTVGGVTYTVSAFSGTTTCTLSGAPNQGPVAFTIVNAASFASVTFGTVGGAPGKGAVTVVAKLSTGSTATAVKNKTYLT